ncbi:glycosyl hydrolase 2 galactose-binding domain-containing protein [Amycolatopsis anabasis]|uniref:glycosyl hydrolase 2 galactose-binding domain-containing protein n=1 Tax=Amycolatopsis anabasis TaxID=1840409 RepID=UPI00131E5A0B|nr:beta-mannosidase [Amycolatopsis anabasis]
MRKPRIARLALGAAVLLLPALVAVGAPAAADPDAEFAGPQRAPITLGTQGWQVQSSELAKQPGEQVSSPDFAPRGWLPVKPDDAGAPGTELNALVQNGECPDVFYADNMRKCFGYMPKLGPVTVPRFAVPWWFRTDFTPQVKPGQSAKLLMPGVVGEADVWVNGKLVADRETVSGSLASRTFDISELVRPGKNSLAIKMYPNNPLTMFTLDQVDWGQIPPDNNTGIMFPVKLQVSDELTGSNAHVKQNTAPDGSRTALTVKTDVTNNSDRAQRAEVSAKITPPDRGRPIVLKQKVTVAPHSTQTVAFTPEKFAQLRIAKPRLWWPYAMGDQPLYTLSTAISQNGRVSTTSQDTFGIRHISSRLVGKSPQAPEGSRIYGINGKEIVFRAGGYAPDLFLRYSKEEVAHHITLIKSLGLNGIRLEGHDMPQDFYDQMDRAGILIYGGFMCCDAWQPEPDAKLTERDYRILYESAVGIGKMERNHPSVFTYSWSDNEPIPRQESETLKGFAETDFDVPVIASAEYKKTPTLGQAGMKEGPYDWVPPSYWYDTTHFDPKDPSRTNVGGSWGFASEQSAGHTVPTLDSIKRFLSPEEQEKLWKDPEYNQYHANFQSGHGGYAFGTLYTFDTAMAKRYGQWSDLDTFVQQAQVANYENVRSQFEAFIAHSTDKQNPSTGIVYWQLNKGWPTLLWSLFNHDGDQPGAFFGAQKANKPLHALFTYDDNTVTVDNLTGSAQRDLSVQARVIDLNGKVLDDQTANGITLASQGVRNAVLKPKVPAATNPPQQAQTYFVELQLKQNGKVVDRNVYWRSTQPDVVDWDKTYGKPQATLSQYGSLQDLQKLAKANVNVTANTRPGQGPNGADTVTTVTVTNTSNTPTVGFFLRADVRRGTGGGQELPGDNQVKTATWDDNNLVLWPGQSQTITASYRAADLRGASPVVTLSGWNAGKLTVPAPNGTGE